MTATVNWPISSGQTLSFEVHDPNTAWNSVPGLYIFCYETATGWHALYVGKTDSFQERIPNHERWDEARLNGATHIHAMVVPLEASRNHWEKALIQHLQPPLNVQHRTVLS